MDLLFVPKPLFNDTMSVEGYYFSYQHGNAIIESAKSNPLDGAMYSPFIAFMNSVGLEALSENKTIFIPVTNILLMTDLEKECRVEPGKVAFLLSRDVQLNDMILGRVIRYKSLGYMIAFRHRDDLTSLRTFLPYADYVFLSQPLVGLDEKLSYMNYHHKNVRLVATDIPNSTEFDSIKHSGLHLFDGPFYKVHIHSNDKYNALPPLKVNYIQLLNIVNQHDFDFQTFSKVIRQDTSLAVAFIRLVNSSGRLSSEIKTINHAAAMLGQREIKKWVSTAVSTALCADKPSEVMRVSLLRAKFCENLAPSFNMPMLGEDLFLTGLFSILDVILELPMEAALSLVFMPETIRVALANRQGEFYHVLSFVLSYEQGDWYEISRIAMLQDIAIKSIHDAYTGAMLWYSQLINLSVDETILYDA